MLGPKAGAMTSPLGVAVAAAAGALGKLKVGKMLVLAGGIAAAAVPETPDAAALEAGNGPAFPQASEMLLKPLGAGLEGAPVAGNADGFCLPFSEGDGANLDSLALG